MAINALGATSDGSTSKEPAGGISGRDRVTEDASATFQRLQASVVENAQVCVYNV